MNLNVVVIKAPVGLFYIDNMYSETELEDIMYELRFLLKHNKMLPPEETGSAMQDEKAIKQNKGLFLDKVYDDRRISDILRVNRKLFSLNIDTTDPTFKMLRNSTLDTTLISYYENSDYYKAHTDRSMLTALTYFYEEPKRFTGGNLYLPEYDITLECAHNRTYLIPSLVEHEAKEISMEKKYLSKGLGRFCMTQFLGFRHE
jgi:predicted transcriptional regulator